MILYGGVLVTRVNIAVQHQTGVELLVRFIVAENNKKKCVFRLMLRRIAYHSVGTGTR